MKHNTFSAEVLILLTAILDLGLLLDTKKDLTKSLTQSVNSSNHNSHEELHSLKTNDTTPVITTVTKEASVTDLQAIDNLNNTFHIKHLNNNTLPTQKGVSASITSAPSIPKTVVVAEGGIEVSTTADYVRINSNETHKDNKTIPLITTTKQPNKTDVESSKSTPVTSGVEDKPIHKRIHGRPGVTMFENSSISNNLNNTVSITTVPPRVHKKKPLFTMVTDDKESESFIESPTTGSDYVLPIVLIILSLPIVGYIIKIIYRRGTEFTERQQYHRMYLIDGMYNSR